jgi:hypothetical protein
LLDTRSVSLVSKVSAVFAFFAVVYFFREGFQAKKWNGKTAKTASSSFTAEDAEGAERHSLPAVGGACSALLSLCCNLAAISGV